MAAIYSDVDRLILDRWDLGQLIEDSLRLQLPTLQRHGITVTRELASVAWVRVDRHKVLQILINLLSNAKDAMAETPEGQRQLCVRLTDEGHMARIQVVDAMKVKENAGWAIGFLGANIDSWAVGQSIGMQHQQGAANFEATPAGVKRAFGRMSVATSNYSANPRGVQKRGLFANVDEEESSTP